MATTTILFAARSDTDDTALGELDLAFDHTITRVTTPAELLEKLSAEVPATLLLDLELSDGDNELELLRTVHSSYAQLPILPLIPADRPWLIKDILELGIYFAIHTPMNAAETSSLLTRLHETLPQSKETPEPQQSSVLPRRSAKPFHGMIGVSPSMRQLFSLIEKVAADDYSTVLIRGESGTGKEMVARAIHIHSSRTSQNFVPVNCAAIPDDLLESELFGYTKGAFTGANANKIGRIQYADKGTLFLDEIGDMKHTLQAKLLRVIQEREFEPVGAFKAIPVNTRILAATHCDLEKLVEEGTFREDLYYRLSVVPINIPSLRERAEDIPWLINNFLTKYAEKRDRQPFSFSHDALAAVIHYHWRGNVRELENLIQHMTILFAGKRIELADLPEQFQDVKVPEDFTFEFADPDQSLISEDPDSTGVPNRLPKEAEWGRGVDFNELINDYETQLIIKAMRQTGGNKKEAAKLLNLKRTTLLEKIKKKAIEGMWEK